MKQIKAAIQLPQALLMLAIAVEQYGKDGKLTLPRTAYDSMGPSVDLDVHATWLDENHVGDVTLEMTKETLQ